MYEFFHYLPVNDDVMKWGFYLIAAGRGVIPANSNYPPEEHPDLYGFPFSRGRRLPEYQIIVITNGYGVFESKETGMVQIKPDTLLLLFPDTWHRYKPEIAIFATKDAKFTCKNRFLMPVNARFPA